ncbi:MAG: LysR substrate-binding domain-containing protein [Pseudomonadota bacterium]
MVSTAPFPTKGLPLRATPPLAALQAFERAAAHLSFRRAAHDLALSPSAVSHQIRGLEDYFGVRLFSREGRSVTLTAKGDRYLKSVTSGLLLLDEASREMLRYAHGAPRDLRLSAMPYFAQAVLLPQLADFERRHPAVTLRIEATGEYADFAGGGIDVAVRYGREQSSGLRLEPLLEVRQSPVASPALVARGLRTPRDLPGYKLIHVVGHRNAWMSWLLEMGQETSSPSGEIWVENVSAALDAAEHGLGVALGMHPLIESRPGYGETLVAPFAQTTRRSETIYFVCRPEHARDKRIALFRDWLDRAVERTIGPATATLAAE